MNLIATLAAVWAACAVTCLAWMGGCVLVGQRRDRDAAGFDVAVDEACALVDVEADWAAWEQEVGA